MMSVRFWLKYTLRMRTPVSQGLSIYTHYIRTYSTNYKERIETVRVNFCHTLLQCHGKVRANASP